jgi:small subunit ribosomal protein S20
MANHPSAQKRNRQRVRRTERNRNVRSAVRTTVKKARAAIGAGDPTSAAAEVQRASKALAKAASKRVIHPKTASRTKARVQTALARLAKT